MKTQQTNKIEWRDINFLDCLEKEASRNNLKIQGKDFLGEGKYPIIDQGEEFIAGYTNDKSKVYDEKLPVIVFGDHTRILKFVNFPFALGADGVKILVAKENIDPKYLYYVLKKTNISSAGYSRHYKFLKEIKIPIPHTPDGKPDLVTQKQIVAILEKAENLKQKQKRTLELYDEYLKSVFWEMFLSHRDDSKEPKDKWKWEEKSLSEVCDFIDYRGKTPKKTKSGIKLITAKNVKKGYIDNKPQEFIAESDYESWMTRGFPKKGDVLFTTEAPLGNVAVLGEFNKIALAQRIITLQTKEKLNPFYLMYFLLSPNFQNKLEKDTTGSTVTGIRAKEFKKISVPLPPLLLQQKFANIVEKVEKLKEKQKKNLADSEELFNVLMQRAFKGELR